MELKQQGFRWEITRGMFIFTFEGETTTMPVSSIRGLVNTPQGGLHILAAHKDLSVYIPTNYVEKDLLKSELVSAMEKNWVPLRKSHGTH